jgi:hypothetical protein
LSMNFKTNIQSQFCNFIFSHKRCVVASLRSLRENNLQISLPNLPNLRGISTKKPGEVRSPGLYPFIELLSFTNHICVYTFRTTGFVYFPGLLYVPG